MIDNTEYQEVEIQFANTEVVLLERCLSHGVTPQSRRCAYPWRWPEKSAAELRNVV